MFPAAYLRPAPSIHHQPRILEDLLHLFDEGAYLTEIQRPVIEADAHGQNGADLHLLVALLVSDHRGAALHGADADGADLGRHDHQHIQRALDALGGRAHVGDGDGALLEIVDGDLLCVGSCRTPPSPGPLRG